MKTIKLSHIELYPVDIEGSIEYISKRIFQLGNYWRFPVDKEMIYMRRLLELGIGGFSINQYWVDREPWIDDEDSHSSMYLDYKPRFDVNDIEANLLVRLVRDI